MSGNFAQDDGFFSGAYGDQQQTGYDMPYTQGTNNDFGSFDYSQQGQGGNFQQPFDQTNTGQAYSQPQQPYMGNILTPDQSSYAQAQSTDEEDYENEPPLLEELGKKKC